MRRSWTAATKFEPKARIEIATVIFSTARQTRDRAANAADARKFFFAVRANINKSWRKTFRSERQIVTTCFVGDFQIDTRSSPFFSVRRDSPPTSSKLREQMRQFMTQRPIYLVNAVIHQAWIE
jgi:hypothetical protein